MQGQWLGTWGGDWLGHPAGGESPIVAAAIHAGGVGAALFSPVVQTNKPEYSYDGSRRLALRRLAAKQRREDEETLVCFS